MKDNVKYTATVIHVLLCSLLRAHLSRTYRSGGFGNSLRLALHWFLKRRIFLTSSRTLIVGYAEKLRTLAARMAALGSIPGNNLVPLTPVADVLPRTGKHNKLFQHPHPTPLPAHKMELGLCQIVQ
ncbi:hypothetical protein L218DRAFT_747260 [Marasmius fiardii PR-910]|nr:hypothetical protein L218DRAFT_747260 [Marasmius fiardii PR-910]